MKLVTLFENRMYPVKKSRSIKLEGVLQNNTKDMILKENGIFSCRTLFWLRCLW